MREKSSLVGTIAVNIDDLPAGQLPHFRQEFITGQEHFALSLPGAVLWFRRDQLESLQFRIISALHYAQLPLPFNAPTGPEGTK